MSGIATPYSDTTRASALAVGLVEALQTALAKANAVESLLLVPLIQRAVDLDHDIRCLNSAQVEDAKNAEASEFDATIAGL